MKFKINCSPHLTMADITKQLFNCEFLSDIKFSVDGKIIFAHSLELMKRSVVFQTILSDTFGEQKFIPIADFTYDNFLEFLRFIYTDECDINDKNGIELLKLATKYKVIKLENKLLNTLDTIKWGVELFEHCVINNYKMARNFSDIQFETNFWARANSNQFLLLHPDALYELLQFNRIERGITEVQIFLRLADWICNYCKRSQIELKDARYRFDNLIKKIRFPTMTIFELRQCAEKYPALLNETDMEALTKKNFVSRRFTLFNLWNPVPRESSESPFCWKKFAYDKEFTTTILVCRNIILHGLWFGVPNISLDRRPNIEIEISEKHVETNECENLVFSLEYPELNKIAINLGDSLCLKPKFIYTIVIRYLNCRKTTGILISCRKEYQDVIYNDPERAVKLINASANLLEIIFKVPTK